jgi:DNA polymerase-4
VARRAQKEIDQRLRLGPNAGLAANKLVSGVAAQVLKPVSLMDVQRGQEAGFLSPLAVRCLPAVDPRTEGSLLDELNIHRVGDLAAVDLPRLSLAFGARGITLYRQARGIDESPVRPPDRAPAVEADETLAEDTNDDALLLSCLYALVERCGARLRRLGLPAGEGSLTARYTDGVTVTRRTAIAPASAGDLTLYARIRPLFEQVIQRRGRVRYLRVRFTKLEPASAPAQLTLFDANETSLEPAVIAALDRIRGRFGAGAIAFGRTAAGKVHHAA